MNRTAYLACVARPAPHAAERLRNVAERLRSPAMVELVELHGLLVCGDPSAAQLALPTGDGIILGHLFDRKDSTRVTDPANSVTFPSTNS